MFKIRIELKMSFRNASIEMKKEIDITFTGER